MTAAFLYTISRLPVDADYLESDTFAGLVEGDCSWRQFMVKPAGQLWEREAERDVRVHGQPTPHPFPDHRASFWLRPEERRRQVAEGIERHRPAMRARRG